MKKCICKTSPVIKDEKTGEILAISYEENYTCPAHHPEYSCEHIWKSGGTYKDVMGIFCEKCGTTKKEKLSRF